MPLKTIEQLSPPPPRPDDGHKGTFGTVIVVGGCPTMLGAPALCASAALRGGAGLVKVATETAILAHVLTLEPSATGIAIQGDAARRALQIEAAAADHDAVLAIGPGLGDSGDRDAWVLALLAKPWRGVVLDADGLNALARSGARLAEHGAGALRVLTPHPGEFRRLAKPLNIIADPTNPAQRGDAAAQLALAHDAVVVLKGKHTVVSDGQNIYTSTTGNPALATAGTGDVLTGLIAGLIAQRMPALDAACLAVHAHGLAADTWTQRHGPAGLLARELAAALPDALNALRV